MNSSAAIGQTKNANTNKVGMKVFMRSAVYRMKLGHRRLMARTATAKLTAIPAAGDGDGLCPQRMVLTTSGGN